MKIRDQLEKLGQIEQTLLDPNLSLNDKMAQLTQALPLIETIMHTLENAPKLRVEVLAEDGTRKKFE